MTKIPHIRISLLKRFVKFHDKLCNSTKPEVRHLCNIQKFDCRSTFGRNYFNILKEYKICDIHELDTNNISMPIDINENDKWILLFLKELLNVRDGTLETNLSALEINDIIDYLCTN